MIARAPQTIEWVGDADGHLRLLDQTLLPTRTEFLNCRSAEQVHAAIRKLAVRGAPAIGVAGAFGLCLGMREVRERRGATAGDFRVALAEQNEYVGNARPTAVNLRWAVERVRRAGESALSAGIEVEQVWAAMLGEARRIAAEDAAICRRIGEHGAALIRDGMGVLTHCNAGALATTAWGTALAAIYVAHEQGRKFRIYADETRPLLQGARLTAFELSESGLDVTVICDSMAASLMASGRVQIVLVGADRIASNGDTANKIGTLGVAILARHYKIPFYVAAPVSTFDMSLASGAGIPLEQRSEHEIRQWFGSEVVPAKAAVWNPAFDVTPADLIRGIVTEQGIVGPVTEENIRSIGVA